MLDKALAVRGGDFQPVANERLNWADVRHHISVDTGDVLNVLAALKEGFCRFPSQILVDLAGQVNPGAVGAGHLKSGVIDSHGPFSFSAVMRRCHGT